MPNSFQFVESRIKNEIFGTKELTTLKISLPRIAKSLLFAQRSRSAEIRAKMVARKRKAGFVTCLAKLSQSGILGSRGIRCATIYMYEVRVQPAHKVKAKLDERSRRTSEKRTSEELVELCAGCESSRSR